MLFYALSWDHFIFSMMLEEKNSCWHISWMFFLVQNVFHSIFELFKKKKIEAPGKLTFKLFRRIFNRHSFSIKNFPHSCFWEEAFRAGKKIIIVKSCFLFSNGIMFNLWDYKEDEFKDWCWENRNIFKISARQNKRKKSFKSSRSSSIVRSTWLNINYITKKNDEESCWTWSTCALLRHRNNWTHTFGYSSIIELKKSTSFILMRQNEFIFSPRAHSHAGKFVSNENPWYAHERELNQILPTTFLIVINWINTTTCSSDIPS